ncbi:aminomethyltransferase beta-barrel domain-containing protein [Klebsiella pneumoniae]|uniref:aminomethyltransferase beta-barrel domain-containing protein n=1 Tax=Klebsiella pneumoniae TaxID=573 RepID=UPI003CC7D94A
MRIKLLSATVAECKLKKASVIRKVTQNENGYIFEFSAPQWAPAVGQSLVLFQENECLGGGVISEIH